MTSLQKLVLTKAKLAHVRDQVAPGKYEVDFSVRISGTVNVGEDYLITPTSHLSPLVILGIVLSKVDAHTRELMLEHIEKVAEESFDGESMSGMSEQLSARVEKVVGRVRARFAETLPKVKNSGPVALKVQIDHLT